MNIIEIAIFLRKKRENQRYTENEDQQRFHPVLKHCKNGIRLYLKIGMALYHSRVVSAAFFNRLIVILVLGILAVRAEYTPDGFSAFEKLYLPWPLNMQIIPVITSSIHMKIFVYLIHMHMQLYLL